MVIKGSQELQQNVRLVVLKDSTISHFRSCKMFLLEAARNISTQFNLGLKK